MAILDSTGGSAEKLQGHIHIKLMVSCPCSPFILHHQLNPSSEKRFSECPLIKNLCHALHCQASLLPLWDVTSWWFQVPALHVPFTVWFLPLVPSSGLISSRGLLLQELTSTQSNTWSAHLFLTLSIYNTLSEAKGHGDWRKWSFPFLSVSDDWHSIVLRLPPPWARGPHEDCSSKYE